MGIRNRIIIKTRLQVLKRTVTDIFEGAYSNHSNYFNSYARIIRTIELGIEKEYLGTIKVVGKYNESVVNQLVFKIDWEKHTVFCNSGENTLKVDSERSIAEQISGALPVLASYIQNSLAAGEIDKISVYFNYRDGANQNDASTELGLSDLDENDQSQLNQFNESNFVVEIEPEDLQELSIILRTKNRIDPS